MNINLRIWDLENKVMGFFPNSDGLFEINDFRGMTNVYELSYVYYRKDKYIIMEHSGVNDFWENDLILIKDSYTDVIEYGQGPQQTENHIGKVVFKYGSWGIYIEESLDNFKKGFYSFEELRKEYPDTFNSLQKIGNIFENIKNINNK